MSGDVVKSEKMRGFGAVHESASKRNKIIANDAQNIMTKNVHT